MSNIYHVDFNIIYNSIITFITYVKTLVVDMTILIMTIIECTEIVKRQLKDLKKGKEMD